MSLSLSVLHGCTGGSRGDTAIVVEPIVIDKSVTIDHFLRFINLQPSLAAGEYVVVAATATAGESGPYSLTVQYDDGFSENISGEWVTSGGQNPLDVNNPRHTITLPSPGGLRLTLESSVDSYLYLMLNDNIIAQNDDNGDDRNALLAFDNSKINTASYARAYYKAVDPFDERLTLEDWKAMNGFSQGTDQHFTFRDKLNLGYGRDMYSRTRSDGGFAVFVDNYLVAFGEGDASSYSPLGLDAALARDETFHIGSNAIEFSPIDPTDPSSDKIVKLFSFGPFDESRIQQRILNIDLDGRGSKFIPTVCLICHGGPPYPLNADGSFPEVTLRSIKMNILDPGHFAFSDQAGFTIEDSQSPMRGINQNIHSSFLEMNSRSDDNRAKWNGDHAIDLISGAYDGDFSSERYNENFVPAGWRQTATRPEGVEQLYLGVIKKHCIVCHSLMGTNSAQGIKVQVNGESISLANTINFNSYEQFIANKDQTIDDVFRIGQMPRALLNFNAFWADPEGAPTLLAKFLPGFDVYDEKGGISQPRKPLAVPGESRTSTSPANLNASGSFLAQSYSWKVLSAPVSATASLSTTTSPNTILKADIDGDYVIQLTVTNTANISDTKQITIKIDSHLNPATTKLTFTSDIKPILSSCSGCHVEGGFFKGIPVSFDENNPNLYLDVRDRVNFQNPTRSLLISKPTHIRHGGGVVVDRKTERGEKIYQTLLNWIINGAPCGDDPITCPN